MNIQRIQAIFEKDLKDFSKNTMFLFTPFIPILIAILYNRMDAGMDDEMPMMLYYFTIGIAFSAVTSALIMMFMAEEKEKKTLRGLMLSPASFLDIVIGKSAVVTVLSFASVLISLFILGIEPMMDLQIILGILVAYGFFLFLGLGIGLFTNNVGITTAYYMPIMLIFGFTPMIELMIPSADSTIRKVADTFPIMQLYEMHHTGSWWNMLVLFIWTLAAFIFLVVCYKGARRDE